MNGVAPDKIPLVGWWDVLDDLLSAGGSKDLERAVQLARECQHEDAKWLGSLFPAGVAVTRKGMLEVLGAQGDDARAMHVTWLLDVGPEHSLLQRAAELGYAPSQADMASVLNSEGRREEAFALAEKAAAQGHRDGLAVLAGLLEGGIGYSQVSAKALYRAAAELNCVDAQYELGLRAYCETDWERYRWWGRAALRTWRGEELVVVAVRFLPSFEAGKLGRVLFEIAPVVNAKLDLAEGKLFGMSHSADKLKKMQRVVELWNARCALARRAIGCWSAAGRRLGVAKDMRILIAKLAWEERWRWGEMDESGSSQTGE